MNNLQIFKNEEFGEIRTVTIDNEIWFAVIDICRALHLSSDPTMLVRKLDEDEKTKIDLGFRGSAMNCVNERGFYHLMSTSRKEGTKRFKKWIVCDVIPSIRKTYDYKLPKTADDMIKLLIKENSELSRKIDNVNKDLQKFKQDILTLRTGESKITSAVRRKGVECLGGKESEAYKNNSLREKVYADIYGQLKREFGVTTYKAIKRNQCDQAVAVIDCYQLPIFLEEAINDCNAQMSL